MRWTHLILYFVALPWNLLVAWPVVLLVRVFWGKNLRWETPPPYTRVKGGGGGPVLTCQMRPGSFPVTPGKWPRGWYLRSRDEDNPVPWGGTALGHGIFYGPLVQMDHWSRTRAHEHIHVEQHEVACLGSFIVGIAVLVTLLALGHPTAAWVLFLFLWTTGYLMMGVAGWLAAMLRGEPAYWGSSHEESARAQDNGLVVR